MELVFFTFFLGFSFPFLFPPPPHPPHWPKHEVIFSRLWLLLRFEPDPSASRIPGIKKRTAGLARWTREHTMFTYIFLVRQLSQRALKKALRHISAVHLPLYILYFYRLAIWNETLNAAVVMIQQTSFHLSRSFKCFGFLGKTAESRFFVLFPSANVSTVCSRQTLSQPNGDVDLSHCSLCSFYLLPALRFWHPNCRCWSLKLMAALYLWQTWELSIYNYTVTFTQTQRHFFT